MLRWLFGPLPSRAYCHLCDEMREAALSVAEEYGATIVESDVDAHPALEKQYGERVPVLMYGAPEDGVEICDLRFDRSAVVRVLTMLV